MIEIPFYQVKWHDIDISGLAVKNNHDFDDLAGSDIYRSLYERMSLKEDFSISDVFIKEKKNLSSWIFKVLQENGHPSARVLSLGCGIGLVEQELLQKGLNLDLQESQDISIKYLKRFHKEAFEKLNFICSDDISDIESNKYDVVLAITCSYCLDRRTLGCFVSDIKRVLKNGGIFIWYDAAYTFKFFIRSLYWKIKKTKHAGVHWGWLRPIPLWGKLVKEHGFSFERTIFFDKKNNVINPVNILNIPFGSTVKWQAVVLKK